MNKRILIANRGEIAIRIIRSAKKLGLTTCVIQGNREPDAMYLEYADEVILSGESGRQDYLPQSRRDLRLALEHKIDMIHPVTAICRRIPTSLPCVNRTASSLWASSELIRNMGIKTIAKKMAAEAGMPLVPGSDGAITDARVAKEFADRIGYPVILKASVAADEACVLWRNRRPWSAISGRPTTRQWPLSGTGISLSRST